MSCPAPGKLEQFALALLDAEQGFALQTHLRRCDACQARMQALHQRQLPLEAVLAGWRAPTETLIERVLADLPPPEPPPRSPWQRPLAITVAALMLVGAGVFFLGRELGVVGALRVGVAEQRYVVIDGQPPGAEWRLEQRALVGPGGRLELAFPGGARLVAEAGSELVRRRAPPGWAALELLQGALELNGVGAALRVTTALAEVEAEDGQGRLTFQTEPPRLEILVSQGRWTLERGKVRRALPPRAEPYAIPEREEPVGATPSQPPAPIERPPETPPVAQPDVGKPAVTAPRGPGREGLAAYPHPLFPGLAPPGAPQRLTLAAGIHDAPALWRELGRAAGLNLAAERLSELPSGRWAVRLRGVETGRTLGLLAQLAGRRLRREADRWTLVPAPTAASGEAERAEHIWSLSLAGTAPGPAWRKAGAGPIATEGLATLLECWNKTFESAEVSWVLGPRALEALEGGSPPAGATAALSLIESLEGRTGGKARYFDDLLLLDESLPARGADGFAWREVRLDLAGHWWTFREAAEELAQRKTVTLLLDPQIHAREDKLLWPGGGSTTLGELLAAVSAQADIRCQGVLAAQDQQSLVVVAVAPPLPDLGQAAFRRWLEAADDGDPRSLRERLEALPALFDPKLSARWSADPASLSSGEQQQMLRWHVGRRLAALREAAGGGLSAEWLGLTLGALRERLRAADPAVSRGLSRAGAGSKPPAEASTEADSAGQARGLHAVLEGFYDRPDRWPPQ